MEYSRGMLQIYLWSIPVELITKEVLHHDEKLVRIETHLIHVPQLFRGYKRWLWNCLKPSTLTPVIAVVWTSRTMTELKDTSKHYNKSPK